MLDSSDDAVEYEVPEGYRLVKVEDIKRQDNLRRKHNSRDKELVRPSTMPTEVKNALPSSRTTIS